ncbi:MAG: hypothetical protein F6K42_29300, partial [Leptolyngbya sp. SIO1D8]|nr:hypothetical protein [Leptolyngbya sp. SIO1D8]
MVTLSPVLPIHSQILPGHNQEIYQRLQHALQATPPHQLWIAVCDDLPLQRQLAATLEASWQTQGAIAPTQLLFSAHDPDLVHQLQAWVQRPAHERPALLQILGIEQLTYRGADQQYRFLMSLHGLLPVWQKLGCSLLIWLPRPWLKQVKRVVPNLCNQVFEFMGEPTPLSSVTVDQSHQAAFSPIHQWQFLDQPDLEVFPTQSSSLASETTPTNLESATDPVGPETNTTGAGDILDADTEALTFSA